ncbi:hypothetical protein STEG23_032839 [Scotinomys teguina]
MSLLQYHMADERHKVWCVSVLDENPSQLHLTNGKTLWNLSICKCNIDLEDLVYRHISCKPFTQCPASSSMSCFPITEPLLELNALSDLKINIKLLQFNVSW